MKRTLKPYVLYVCSLISLYYQLQFFRSRNSFASPIAIYAHFLFSFIGKIENERENTFTSVLLLLQTLLHSGLLLFLSQISRFDVYFVLALMFMLLLPLDFANHSSSSPFKFVSISFCSLFQSSICVQDAFLFISKYIWRTIVCFVLSVYIYYHLGFTSAQDLGVCSSVWVDT